MENFPHTFPAQIRKDSATCGRVNPIIRNESNPISPAPVTRKKICKNVEGSLLQNITTDTDVIRRITMFNKINLVKIIDDALPGDILCRDMVRIMTGCPPKAKGVSVLKSTRNRGTLKSTGPCIGSLTP